MLIVKSYTSYTPLVKCSGERVVAVCSFSERSGKVVLVIILNDEKCVMCCHIMCDLSDLRSASLTRSLKV